MTPHQRSYLMSRIRPKDTKPELALRHMIHALGYRYRLHDHNLCGRPDLVFPRRRKVILLHGCFWHRHDCPKGRSTPASKIDFWLAKFNATKERDARNKKALKRAGWDVLTIWECELKEMARVRVRVTQFLGPTGAQTSR